jgi:hypothetical protein
VPGERRRAVGDVAVDGVDEDDRLLARVVAASKDGEGAQRGGVDGEAADDRGAQVGVAVVERQTQFGETDQGSGHGGVDCRGRPAARRDAASLQWNASIRVAPISGSSRRPSGLSAE